MDHLTQLARIFEGMISNQTTLETNSNFVYSWVRLGDLFQKQGRYNEAIEAYQQALNLKPDNAHLWNEFGNVNYNAGFLDSAINAYFQAIRLDERLGWAYTNLALALIRQKKYQEAETLFQKGLEFLIQVTDKAIAWNRLGNLYREEDKHQKAFLAYQMADQLDPKTNRVPSKRHQIHDDYGQIEDVVIIAENNRQFKKKKTWWLSGKTPSHNGSDPTGAQLWNELGNIHFFKEEYNDAMAAYEQAIKLDNGFGWAYCNLALVFTRKGEYEKAIPLYKKSLNLIEDSPQKALSWNGLGNLYRAIGDYFNATLAFQRADELKMIDPNLF